MVDIFSRDDDNDMISQARWLQLAGLDKLEPTAAELTADELIVGCQGYLWEVTLGGPKEQPRALITAERDIASVEAALRGSAVKEAVMSITYRGKIAGTAAIDDDKLVERLTKLRSYEEREAKRNSKLGRLSPLEAMQPSDMKFVTKIVQADGTPITLTLNKAQEAEALRLAKSWDPDHLEHATNAIIQKACQNAAAANVNLTAENACLSFFERVLHEVQVLLQSEIEAGHADVVQRLKKLSASAGPDGSMPGFIIDDSMGRDFPQTAPGLGCVDPRDVKCDDRSTDDDTPTGMHHFDS